MRILVLNYEFPPVGGGGGSASAALGQELSRRGHQVRVLTSMASGTPRREQLGGYEVWRVPTGRRSRFRASFASMGAYVVSGLIPGWRLIRSWRPHVIHAHFAVPTGALALGLSRLTGLPYLLTVHLGDVPGGVPEKTDRWFRLVKPLTPPVWRKAAQVVAVSEHTRQLALRTYDVQISVIPNGVRLAATNPPEEEVGDPPRLIFVGRFQPQKNLLALVECLTEVSDQPWRCVLVGDGPQAVEVQRQITKNGLDQRITLTGWVGGERVDELLDNSDILVMPSLSEGLPVAGVQALAHGLAIIATAAGGLTELVSDGSNGRLTAVGDMRAFAAALRWSLGDIDRLRRMKSASRERANKYDIVTVANAYEEALQAVARG